MNKNIIYDLFKEKKLYNLKNVEIFGDVKTYVDNKIVKNVIHINGSHQKSNCLKYPIKSKNIDLKYKYIIIQLFTRMGSCYSFSFEININSIGVIRLNFSNYYKEIKKINDHIIQNPIPLMCNKWTTICYNLEEIILKYYRTTQYKIKAFEFSSNIILKGIYFSDVDYKGKRIPNNLNFKVNEKNYNTEKYNWFSINSEDKVDNKLKYVKNPEKKIKKTKNPVNIEIEKPNFKIPLPYSISNNNNKKLNINTFKFTCDPILKLHNTSGLNIFQKKILNYNDKIIISSDKTIISINPNTNLQEFYIGHKNKITNFLIIENDNLLISSSKNEIYFWKLFNKEFIEKIQIDAEKVLFFDYYSTNKTNFIAILSFDNNKRILLQIYIVNNYKLISKIKQISNFQIFNIKFINENFIISYGYNNLLLWEIKDNYLKQIPINFKTPITSNFTSILKINLNNNIIIYITNDEGNVFKFSFNTMKINNIIKLHNKSISSICYDYNNNYFITGSKDKSIKIWNFDFNEKLFEFEIESEIVNINISNQGYICILENNGSLNCIKPKLNLLNQIIRSHSDNIIDLDYNSSLGILITISKDNKISLWDINDMLSQIYEFSCIDKNPYCVKSFNNLEEFIVSFDDGIIRKFDAKNYTINKEILIPNFQYSVKIIIKEDDNLIYLSNFEGYIIILNQELEKISEYKSYYKKFSFNFNLIENNLLVKTEDNYLKLLDNEYKIVQYIEEDIKQFKFNNCLNHLICLTDKFEIIWYKYDENSFKFLKRFNNICDNIINFYFSENNKYFFILDSLGNIIIFDYNFKGDDSPYFQKISINEKQKNLLIINNLDIILSYGLKNNKINLWKFQDSLSKGVQYKLNIDFNFKECNNKLSLEKEVIKPQTPSIYKNPLKNEKINIEKFLEEINESDSSKEYEANENLSVKNVQENFSEKLNEKIIEENSNDNIKKEEKFLIKNISSIENFLGFDCSTGFIWNLKYDFYITCYKNYLIFNDLVVENNQNILNLETIDDIKWLRVSFNEDFTIAFSQETTNEFNCKGFLIDNRNKEVSYMIDGLNLKIISDCIFTCDNNFLVISGKENSNDELNVILVYSILNKIIVTQSAINYEIKSIKNNIFSKKEFITLTPNKIFFWKIDKNNLIYQELELKGKNLDNNFESMEVLQLNDINKTILLILGTKHGSLLFIDIRSNNVLGYYNFFINEKIKHIRITNEKLIIFNNLNNIYINEISIDSVENFINNLNEDYTILTINGKIKNVFNPYDKTIQEGFVSTSNNTLYFYDYKEKGNIKLVSWHFYNKICSSYFDNKNNLILTSGNDFSVKYWGNNWISEQLTPNKTCLCINNISNLYLLGFNDGVIRVYDMNEFLLLTKFDIKYPCYNDYEKENNQIISIRFLRNNTTNFLIGSSNGIISMGYFESLEGIPLVKIGLLIRLNTPIYNIEINPFNRLYDFSINTNIEILIYNRKNLLKNSQNNNDAMDLKWINNLEYLLFDRYKIVEKIQENTSSVSCFDKNNENYILISHTSFNILYLRNFSDHTIISKFALSDTINIIYSKKFINYFYIGTNLGNIVKYDSNNNQIYEKNLSSGKILNISINNNNILNIITNKGIIRLNDN